MNRMCTPCEELCFSGQMLVGHGFHPGEPRMKQLYHDFARAPLANVRHTILAPYEWELGSRLVDGENLSSAVPDPDGSRPQRMLATYAETTSRYTVAIHPHSIIYPDTEVAIYGAEAVPLVRAIASYLGFSQAIIRTQGIEAVRPNAMSVEIGDTCSFLSPARFQEKITAIAEGLPLAPMPMEEYAYVADVTTLTAKQLGLQERYGTFEPLTTRDAEALSDYLGVETVDLYAYAWDGALFDDTHGFRGELVGRPVPAVTYCGNI